MKELLVVVGKAELIMDGMDGTVLEGRIFILGVVMDRGGRRVFMVGSMAIGNKEILLLGTIRAMMECSGSKSVIGGVCEQMS